MTDIRAVFEVSYRRLVGQLYAVCGDLTEAEEAVAEAFVRAVCHARAFGAAENPEAWLRTVAVNVARTRHRRRLVGERLRLRLVTTAPSRHPDLSADRLALVAAMQQLHPTQSEALALHYLADLPVHEVAATLGVPIGTVKARLSRGRKALATLLSTPEPAAVEGGPRA